MTIRRFLIVCAFLSSLIACSNDENHKPDTKWPEITTEAKPWTRWWWLGSDVDEQGLTYNLTEMSKAGLGGVEITPIYGVQNREKHYIDYLSSDWMKMLAFSESEAKHLGMKVDMNNGTGWPFGGPSVSIDDAATKAIFQKYNLKSGESLNEKILIKDPKQKGFAKLNKVIAYLKSDTRIDITNKISESGKLHWQAPEDAQIIALFIGKTRQQVKRAAPGGKGYVLNHFDKDAVQRYFNKFDKAFINNTTEFPNCFFNDSYEVYGADWTSNLLQEFELRRGYKLQSYFPELLGKGENDLSRRVICDYRETIGDILKEYFTIPWTKWAHKHGALTRNQAHGSPANLIDLYAAVDIPECETFGISDFDIPGLRKDNIKKKNDGDPTTLKYASSAAHISGKKYTSSETFTWLTEHFRTSLSQCKPEIDQIFTSGVNHVFFHGSTYSPQKAAWPGWKFYASIDMSPTNTIWKDAPAFFSYITRVQSFLQDGKPDNDFLLYLPIYDIWEKEKGDFYTAFAIHGMRKRLPEFCESVEKIRALGYDLDYISDNFIKSTSVENGLLKTEGGVCYKALILPAVKLIPLDTMQKINQLIAQGATVVFVDNYPADVPGLAKLNERRSTFDNEIQKLPKTESFRSVSTQQLEKGKIITGHNFEKLLTETEANNEPFVSNFGGQLIRRSNDTGYHYFMTMLQNKYINTWVPLGVDAKSAMFFDPMTGKSGKASIRKHNGRTEVYMQLNPGESIILKTFNTDIKANDWLYLGKVSKTIVLDKKWQLQFNDSQPSISDEFTLDSLTSWTELAHDSLKVNKGTGIYSSSFNIRKNKNKEYILNLGDVRESARVVINGIVADTLFAVPFKTNISKLLKDGENTIEIDVTNLPANRIADYDRRGVNWRIFQEINFVSITYKKTKFDIWETMPSGLLGPAYITEVDKLNL
ncbi:MAG: glycosyl hydrolase [Mangrovibacterium sp.]